MAASPRRASVARTLPSRPRRMNCSASRMVFLASTTSGRPRTSPSQNPSWALYGATSAAPAQDDLFGLEDGLLGFAAPRATEDLAEPESEWGVVRGDERRARDEQRDHGEHQQPGRQPPERPVLALDRHQPLEEGLRFGV